MKKAIIILGLLWSNTSMSEGLTNTSRCNIDYLVKLIEIVIEGKPEWKLLVNKKCKIYLANEINEKKN